MSDRQEISVLSLLPPKRFHSCVMTTFSFDFNYFSHDVLYALNRAGVVNSCVFVDDTMLQHYLGTMTGYAAKASRRFSLTAIPRRGAFHPKLSLFFGHEGHGFMIIGSGNLTASGHGANQELWGAFHINGPDDPKAQIFIKAWRYIQSLSTESAGITKKKLEWIENYTPWMKSIPEYHGPAGVNLTDSVQAFLLSSNDGSIFRQLRSILGEESVTCMTLISPFFDTEGIIFDELVAAFGDCELHTIIQPSTCTASFAAPGFGRAVFHDWDTIPSSGKSPRNRYLHAKMLHLQTEKNEYCLFGSANMTVAALGTEKIPARNDEVCLLLRRSGDSWLADLGLEDRGGIIIPRTEPNMDTGPGADASPTLTCHARLLAIDRYCNTLEVYVTPGGVLQDTLLVLFDGWGDVALTIKLRPEYFSAALNCYRLEVPRKTEELESILYGQLVDQSGTILSNKQIVHDVTVLARCNPDPGNQKLEELLTNIEIGDKDILDILNHLNPDDLVGKPKNGNENPGGSNPPAAGDDGDDDGSGEILPYDEFVEPAAGHRNAEVHYHLYSSHKVELVFDTLNIVFKRLQERNPDRFHEDEELDRDTLDSSTGRDDGLPAHKIKLVTKSHFKTIQRKVIKHFTKYIKVLDAQLKNKHKPNIVDLSMFAVTLHLLLDTFLKQIEVKPSEPVEETEIGTILTTDGDYSHKSDYCRLVTDIVGRFTLLLVNGVDNSGDEYLRRRIEHCKKVAYWHGICCIARLTNQKNCPEGIKDWSGLWRLELGLNLRKYLATADCKDDATASIEIAHRVKMMSYPKDRSPQKAVMKYWNSLKQFKVISSEALAFTANTDAETIYSNSFGFAHIRPVTGANGNRQFLVSRPGYGHNSELGDYVGPKFTTRANFTSWDSNDCKQLV